MPDQFFRIDQASRHPDLDVEGGSNVVRAVEALNALHQFQRITGSDEEDALADLLNDLMHLCDRSRFDFNQELDRAREHYQFEIGQGGSLS